MISNSNGGSLKYYHLNFKGQIDFIFYLVSLYFFLTISVYPMLIVTVRNTLIFMIAPDKMPQSNYEITRYTLFYNFIVLMPVAVIAAFL